MLSTNGQVTAHGSIYEEMNRLPETIQNVMKLLDQTIRVDITDGRILIGLFHCLDKDENFILTDTMEYRFNMDIATPSVRSLGMALIPGRHVVKISRKCNNQV